MSPIEELNSIGTLIAQAPDLDALKPIYDRLDEIARSHEDDFEVQLVAADLRDHIVHRGVALRRLVNESNGESAAPLPETAGQKKPLNLRRTLAIGAGIGVVGWLILFVTLVQIARVRNITPAAAPPTQSTQRTGNAAPAPAAAGTVPVDIITTPPGATIQINNDTKCTSNCRVNLAPGNYQVTAMLDGYDPAATGVTVIPGAPINVTLPLVNQAQTVRIFTDLPSGRVLLDGNPGPELQDGQVVFDRVKNGKHKISVFGPSVDANFAFNLVAGKAPAIEGPIAANNLLAVLVGSFGGSATVRSNSAPVKVSLNGKPQGEIGPDGLELKNVSAGDQQLSIGEGLGERKMVVTFGSMPTLTAYLKSDVNSGTLVVSTGEDDVTVYINGKEYRRKTRRGQLRVQILGDVKVRVAKDGFQPEPEQTAEVNKGEETRLAFKLRPRPQVTALQVRGAAPGMQVVIDDRIIGRVGPDGTLSAANLIPGDRAIELRREGYVTKKFTRTFRAGDTLILNGVDVAMVAAAGTLHLVLTPPDAQVSYRRSDESQSHPAQGTTLRLDAGIYTFTARAPGHMERTERVPVVAGETRNVELALAIETVDAPKPKPAATTASASDWSGWANEGGAFVRKGGNRVPVRSGPLNGTITFTAQLRKGGGIFRGGKLRWFIDDGSKVSQFEIDKKHFFAKDATGDGSNEKLDHEELDEKKFTVRIDISQDRITQQLRVGDRWVLLGGQPGRAIPSGRFGFIIPGGDEIAVSDFHFTPK